MAKLKALFQLPTTGRMPAVFIGHGSPMNALHDNPHRRKWISLGSELPQPAAILCISAHWMTLGQSAILGMDQPKTIHDFYGFPPALDQIRYPAPGSPELARMTLDLFKGRARIEDTQWGLDHGCWVPLQAMYPKANIPVVQLSIDMSKPPEYHYQMAKQLKELRNRGVLVLGSGNIVHNLGMMDMQTKSQYDWAIEFDHQSKQLISSADHATLTNVEQLGESAKLAIPSLDHYLPLLYVLAIQDKNDDLTFFNESVEHGSVSMRSLILSK